MWIILSLNIFGAMYFPGIRTTICAISGPANYGKALGAVACTQQIVSVFAGPLFFWFQVCSRLSVRLHHTRVAAQCRKRVASARHCCPVTLSQPQGYPQSKVQPACLSAIAASDSRC